MELLCLITGFSPAAVEVEWLIDGQPGYLTATQSPPQREGGGATYSTSSRVNISHIEWVEGKIFTCQVKHPASHKVIQEHAQYCPGEEVGWGGDSGGEDRVPGGWS